VPTGDGATVALGGATRRSTPAVRTRGGAVPLTGVVRLPLLVGTVHLLIVQLAASLAYRYGTLNSHSAPYGTLPPRVDGFIGHLVNPMRQWDGLWYRLVAIEGYEGASAKAAFWPLFPWTMRLVGDTFGIAYETAGYLIANVSFFVALVFLYRLLIIDFDQRTSACALWVLALFPTSFFFSAVYTESLFLMLMTGALLAARTERWWWAGILGLLAALTRSYGVFLMLPFALLFIQNHGFEIRRYIPRGLAILMPLGGPLIFSRHLDRVQGNPWAWRDVQVEWCRFSAAPWDTLRWGWSGRMGACDSRGVALPPADGADWSWLRELINVPRWELMTSKAWRASLGNSDTLELIGTLLFLALALIGLRRLPLYMSALVIPGLLVPLFQPSTVHALMSMPRFGLTIFPLFVVIATLIEGRAIAKPLAVLSTILLVLLTIQFSQWYWVS
jgi:hypothetical protein